MPPLELAWKSGSLGTARVNPALCWAQGRVETWLCAGHRVAWKPGSVLGTGSRGNPALCWAQGRVETRLCAGHKVEPKISCPSMDI